MIVLQPPLLSEVWGGHPLYLSRNNSVLMDLHWPCSCTAQSSILSIGQYLSLFCEAFSSTILDSSSFPLFHSGQVFHQLVCPLTVVFPQIFFHFTTLFSYPVFFSLFRAPLQGSLPCISQVLQAQIFSLSVLSLCRTDREFLQ